jgi:hypothetical protein
MNLLLVLQNILAIGVPFSVALLLAALGEMFNQRAGVFNLGCEGIMAMGAFLGFLPSFLLKGSALAPWAPAIGIAQFEGIYYWTLGGDDQWLLDDNQNKIPVAGQNGKTPTINKDGYWEIDGETIKGEDGQPIKAVGKDGANGDKGEDGDSFFKSVVQDDENVTFTLTNGDQIVLPKAKEVNFVIERTSLTLKFGASQNLAVTQKGVENLAIAKPDGWRAWLEGDVLTITAPAKENVYAETSGEVSVVAVGATATVIAKVQVLATDEILGGAGAGSSEWEEWN